MAKRLAFAVGLALTFAASTALAQGNSKRPDIWTIPIGVQASEVPDAFVDYACGTNGGPPSRPLRSFSEYAQCPVDANGLHEVYFRYDDEMEYIARALEQEQQVRIYRGTQMYDFPIMTSALIDDTGTIKGLRIVTDPRDAEIRDRNEFWTMGNFLKQRFGAEGWTCVDLPAAEGENPVGTFFVKNHCEKVADGKRYILEQQYLQKKGQTFINPQSGKVEPNAFDSWARFEVYGDDVQLAVNTGRIAARDQQAIR